MSFMLSPTLWTPQKRGLEEVMKIAPSGEPICLYAPTGGGKCLGRGTPVMLYDGRIIPVEQITRGMKLMGPDSKPRTVLSTCQGTDELYRVTPTKGDPYVVNSCHILSLKMTGGNGIGYQRHEIVNIPVDSYLEQTKTFKHCAKGYRVPINFTADAPLQVEPYFLGYWLGDGVTANSTVMVGDKDHEIKEWLAAYARRLSLNLTCDAKGEQGCCKARIGRPVGKGSRFKANPLTAGLRDIGVLGNKHIPHKYKTASRSERLALLAGLIDADGHLSRSGYDYISKIRRLAEDCAFVARSLGLAAYVHRCVKKCCNTVKYGVYYRVSISGDTDIVPCRIARKKAAARKQIKDPLLTGIKVEPIGPGQYFGFEVDGDGLFLLGDFTVTHNTTQAYELFRWAKHLGIGASFYVNRKLLIPQTASRFAAGGLDVGIRAAEFEDQYDPSKQFHICSADTERSRVVNRGTWAFPDSGLIVVDECHIQKTGVMREIIEHYRSRGAMIVGLTATPIALSDWYDHLIVSGKLSEYRDCNALVVAKVFSPTTPDLGKIKRNKTGEYVMDGKKKQIFTQAIVGDVIKDWELRNPDARPTMLFAPGKAESVWLTEQFAHRGVNWCHVDATDAVVDGKRYRLTPDLWFDIQARYKAGEIKGLSCRFKLREGVDLPCTYHAILATPIGSLASFIQTGGRALRYSPETPEEVIVSDHGGNYHRHGSPNDDRPWHDWWNLSEGAVSEMHTAAIKDQKKDEPICCPVCRMERKGGIVCPGCGHTSDKSRRRIIMLDGTMKEVDGKLVRPRFTKRFPDTQEKWSRMFWGYKKKGVEKTFNEMAAYFAYTHGYQPPRNLDYMPKTTADWYLKVKDIEMYRLNNSKMEAVHGQ